MPQAIRAPSLDRAAAARGAEPEEPAEREESEATDVVVVGGGPAGSTTAARLAQRGRRVVLLERVEFPRFHIGESLLPASTPVLARLGVAEELDRRFLRKYSARFLDDAACVGNGAVGLGDARAAPDAHPTASTPGVARYVFSEAFPPAHPYAWQVARDQFDDLLLRRAATLGVDVRERWTVRSVLRRAGRVVGVDATTPSGAAHRIASRVVVDATGREGVVARGAPGEAVGDATLVRARIPGLDQTAVFSQVRGGHRNEGLDAGQIEIVILAGDPSPDTVPGWAWFIPFLDGRSSIGFVLSAETMRAWSGRDQGADAAASPRLEALFDAQLARSPWMRRLVGDAPRIEPVRAAADYSFRAGKIAGDGWVAVGDSAGFIDPLFSTGAHLAMGGGERAAEAIDAALRADDTSAARFEAYAKSVRQATELFLGAVQSFYRGELRTLLFAPEQRPALRRTITSLLAGDVFHSFDSAEGSALWARYFRERFPPSM